MQLPGWVEENKLQDTFQLPVLTLTPTMMNRWASVVAGSGAAQATGVIFTPELLSRQIQIFLELDHSEDRVWRFFSTASSLAQSLAKMMAVLPVTMPVFLGFRDIV